MPHFPQFKQFSQPIGRAHFKSLFLIENNAELNSTWLSPFYHLVEVCYGKKYPLDGTLPSHTILYKSACTEEFWHKKITPDMWAQFCQNFKSKMIFLTYYCLRDVTQHDYVTWFPKKSCNNGQIIFWKHALPNGLFVTLW